MRKSGNKVLALLCDELGYMRFAFVELLCGSTLACAQTGKFGYTVSRVYLTGERPESCDKTHFTRETP